MADPTQDRVTAEQLRLHAYELVNGGTNASDLRKNLFAVAAELTELRVLQATHAETLAKIAEYEKRPWPACEILTKGDACECGMCRVERRLAAKDAQLVQVTAEREELLGQIAEACGRCEAEKLLKEAAEQQVQTLRRALEEIAVLKLCEEDPANCYVDSGPFCGEHNRFISEGMIRQARAVLTDGDTPQETHE